MLCEGRCLKCMFSRSSRQRESISTLFPYYRLSLGILARAVGAFSVLAPMARLDSTARADLFLGLLVVVSHLPLFCWAAALPAALNSR